MKLQPDKSEVQTITAHGPGWVAIDNEKVEASVVLGSRGERFDWGCTRFDQLDAGHFAQLAALNAELVIFGSGERIRFPQPAWLKPLYAQRTGVETMDTAAACRTYNILASEGRHVVAALLIEAPAVAADGS
ncbi:MAG: hypothetical protein EOO26_07675 [Comamonadaceae bacterium]|nr:MAG: hypothetical protein EOO26_07675 [Comamonadaceae bacterium]